MCKIFGADYGIVTTISPQHLQTFKSVENIAKAKNELPKFLKNKLCVFNIDNKFCRSMFDEKVNKKISSVDLKLIFIYGLKLIVLVICSIITSANMV